MINLDHRLLTFGLGIFMKDAWRQFAKNRAALAAAGLIGVVVVAALAAPWVARFDPYAQDWEAIRQGPSGRYWLGTDGSGRDVFSRIVYGARISLQVAGVSVAISLAAGAAMGLAAGYFGKWVDELISRVTDMMFALPDIVLALVIMAALGANRTNLMIAIGVVYTPIFARITRGAVLSVKGQPYIEAARALGLPHRRIMLRHIMPNIMAPLVVQVTLSLAFAILAEAALSFLGLGVEADTPSWGNMLLEGKRIMRQAWWVAVFPGVAITLAVLSFNVLGDGLRDALDPRHAK